MSYCQMDIAAYPIISVAIYILFLKRRMARNDCINYLSALMVQSAIAVINLLFHDFIFVVIVLVYVWVGVG